MKTAIPTIDVLDIALTTIERLDHKGSAKGTCDVIRQHLKELSPILEQTTIPLTDNQKQVLYLDWFNNYITLKHFARCKGLTEEKAKLLIGEGKLIHDASGKPAKKAKDHEHCHAETACWQSDYLCPEGGTNPLKPKQFTVITVSSNANSFGYKSVLCLAEDGEGVEFLVQAYGTDAVPKRGDVVTAGESRWYGAPRALKNRVSATTAKAVIKEALKQLP